MSHMAAWNGMRCCIKMNIRIYYHTIIHAVQTIKYKSITIYAGLYEDIHDTAPPPPLFRLTSHPPDLSDYSMQAESMQPLAETSPLITSAAHRHPDAPASPVFSDWKDFWRRTGRAVQIRAPSFRHDQSCLITPTTNKAQQI